MSDPGAREWRFYIDDMITFAENVIACTDGLDQERFVASRRSRLHRYPADAARVRLGGSPSRIRRHCAEEALRKAA